MEAKATEIANKDKSLKQTLDDALCSKRELEEEVSDLTNALVSTIGVYFEREKKQVSFFYLIVILDKIALLQSCS